MLVLGDNRPRLYAGMLAAGALGGYAMPVYPDATLDEIRHFAHEARRALHAGRGPGAGRQDPRSARSGRDDRAHRLRRPARTGCLPQSRAWSRGKRCRPKAPNDWPREPELARRADRSARSRTALRSSSILRARTGKPKGVVLSPSQPAGRRSQRVPRRGIPVRRGDPGLPADGLGRRLRDHHGRRHRAALHHQHPRAARKRCCTTCARSHPPSIWPRRAAGTTC